MGLLDIFRKKKQADKPKELQRFLQSSPSEQNKSNNNSSVTIKIVSNKLPEPPANNFNAISAYTFWKQVDDSEKIINSTVNPETFFSRYELLIEIVTS